MRHQVQYYSYRDDDWALPDPEELCTFQSSREALDYCELLRRVSGLPLTLRVVTIEVSE